MIEKIFRHGYTDVLLMMGLVISCFVVIYGVNVLYNVRNENINLNKYENQLVESYDPSALLENNQDYTKIVDFLIEEAGKIDSCNVTFISKVYINNRSDWFEANIIVKANEEIKLDIAEHISDEEGIYIGESLRKYLGEFSEDDELLINDRPYKINGIIENDMASGVDNSIYFVWDKCGEKAKNLIRGSLEDYWQEGFFKVVYEGDDNINPAVDSLTKALSDKDIWDVGEEKLYSGDYQNYWYRYYNYIFIGITMVFALANSIIVSLLWLTHRKHEMAVRIAYGYKRTALYGLLIKDSLGLCIIAFGMATLLNVSFSYILGIDNSFRDFGIKIILAFVAMLIILAFIVWFSVNKFMKRNIVKI